MKRIRGSEAKEPNGKCKQLSVAEAPVKGQVRDRIGRVTSSHVKIGFVCHCNTLKYEKSTIISNSNKLKSGQKRLIIGVSTESPTHYL